MNSREKRARAILNTIACEMLPSARNQLARMERGEDVIVQGGAFGDASHDTELRADRELGKLLGNALAKDFDDIGYVSVEGLADVSVGRGKMWATIDPVDGSLNYRDRGHVGAYPYSACITLLECKEGATFNSILGGAVIDLRNGDVWHVHRENGQYRTFTRAHTTPSTAYMASRPSRTHSAEVLNLGQMNGVAEFYYPSNRKKAVEAFADQKGWLRNPGSAAYEMASISSGQAAFFVCDQQKQHEVGFGFAAVKGAGGVAIDWDGNDLGTRPFDFKTQIPVILAANQAIADQLLERLRKSA